MRAVACVFAIIGGFAVPAHAQTESSPSAAYIEFGGSTIFYSLNAELPVAQNRAVRIGAMLLPHLFGATASLNQFIGSSEHRLVLGLGMMVAAHAEDPFAAGTATIGYRHTRRDGSFVQVAATPFLTRDGVHRYAGISIGKSY